jgi:hypothetical protein
MTPLGIIPPIAQTSLPTALGLQDAEYREGCERQFAHAMREMGAFVTAVRRLYGSEAAARAAKYWIELAESANAPVIDRLPNWRKITIAAAGQLAKDHFLDCLSAPQRDEASRPS